MTRPDVSTKAPKAQRGLLRASEAFPQTRGADQYGYYHFRWTGRPQKDDRGGDGCSRGFGVCSVLRHDRELAGGDQVDADEAWQGRPETAPDL